MKTEIVTITPDVARYLLSKNTMNRPIKRQHFEFLCRELTGGHWKLNGDAIRIAKNGTLLDGQHRLRAVLQTGISMKTVLITELDNDVFDTIDIGSARSAADILHVVGEKNCRSIAAALIVVSDIQAGKTDFVSKKISNADILNMLDNHPGIRDSLKWGRALVKLSPDSISVAMHYLFSISSHEKMADRFFASLSTGENLDADSPIYLLRQRLIDNAMSKAKINRRYIAALFIKSWNAWASGLQVKSLRFRETGDAPEQFPMIKTVTP